MEESNSQQYSFIFFKTYNDLRALTFRKLVDWGNENANTIKGTYGAVSSPYKTRKNGYYTFIPDMCRQVSLKFEII
jgi:hypothetical protein